MVIAQAITLYFKKELQLQLKCSITHCSPEQGNKLDEATPVAEWVRSLYFSALNHRSSHRCVSFRFEPRTGHM